MHFEPFWGNITTSYFFPVTIIDFSVNEVDKHILSDKKFTLKPLTSVSSISADNGTELIIIKLKEEIRRKYSRVQMDKRWNKIKARTTIKI